MKHPILKRGYRGVLNLYLQDEAPRIGCGWRPLEVHIGNHFVRLRSAQGRTAKITREEFDQIVLGSHRQITRRAP